MKVGLIGTPGAGKSELAKELARRMEDELAPGEGRGFVQVVDDYAEEASWRVDMAMGFAASYIGNLYIVFERYARERRADANGYTSHRVTCGTLLETATYAAMNGSYQLQVAADEADAADQTKRVQTTMGVLACLYMDTFRYDHLFYLPYVGDDEQNVVLDRDLQAAFEAFNLQEVHTLFVGPDHYVEQAMKIMTEADGD